MPTPNTEITQERFEEYNAIMNDFEAKITDMHNKVNNLKKHKDQLEKLLKDLDNEEIKKKVKYCWIN